VGRVAKNELKEIIREAQKQRWKAKRTKKGHWMLLAPDGLNKVLVSGTPSDRRSLTNAITDMRRYGFRWKGR
jgi:hypothetical protein